MHFCARCSILSYTRCNSAVSILRIDTAELHDSMLQRAQKCTDLQGDTRIFRKRPEKQIQVSSHSDKINGYFTWRPVCVCNNTWQFFLEWKMFLTKAVEKIKTHILCSVTFCVLWLLCSVTFCVLWLLCSVTFCVLWRFAQILAAYKITWKKYDTDRAAIVGNTIWRTALHAG